MSIRQPLETVPTGLLSAVGPKKGKVPLRFPCQNFQASHVAVVIM